MKGTKKIGMLIAIMALFVMSVVVYADPVGVAGGVNVEGSSTRGTVSPYQASALAGNVTELTINATTITNFWQGYYGNITGTIVLANSLNDTLYDWNMATANGQVYASNSNDINWTGIKCANTTEVETEDASISATGKSDAINLTFTGAASTEIYVGSTPVSSCRIANLHDENATDSALFENVLLSDTDGDIVYTSIISNDATGFDNRTHDFQLIVAENGTNGNTATTPFYFWVELS